MITKHDRDELLRWLAGELVDAGGVSHVTLSDIVEMGGLGDATRRSLSQVPLFGVWDALEAKLDALGLAILPKGSVLPGRKGAA